MERLEREITVSMALMIILAVLLKVVAVPTSSVLLSIR